MKNDYKLTFKEGEARSCGKCSTTLGFTTKTETASDNTTITRCICNSAAAVGSKYETNEYSTNFCRKSEVYADNC